MCNLNVLVQAVIRVGRNDPRNVMNKPKLGTVTKMYTTRTGSQPMLHDRGEQWRLTVSITRILDSTHLQQR